MINSPTKNIEFTYEQLAAIDEAKNRLSRLESEITASSKNLRVINLEVVKATKERNYQDELAARTVAEVKKASQELEKLQAENSILKKESDKVSKTIKVDSEKHLAKGKALTEREEKITVRESELKVAEADVRAKTDALEKSANLHQQKVDVLAKALQEVS